MSIKRFFILSIFASSMLLISNSCKKCTVAEENTDSGIIVKGAIIYPKSGYVTSNTSSNHFTSSSDYANQFEVSFDGGQTRVPVDFGTYDILASPMTIKCKASFERDVNVDNINNIVTYTVTATTCSSCENERFVENYVLVPKIASGMTVWFDPEINEN